MQAKGPLPESFSLRMSDLLLVTGSHEDAALWVRQLEQSGWQGRADVLTDAAEIYQRCQGHIYHAILLDQSHPLITSRLTSELLRRLDGHPPVILITDAPGEMSALEGLAQGAFDYVFRSCISRLPAATQRAVEATDLRENLAGADDQMRESDHRFQALTEIVNVGVAVEGADGILHANQALAFLLNASSPLDLLGRSLVSYVPTEYQSALQEKLRAATSNHDPLYLDLRLITLDGSPAEVRLTAIDIGFHGQPARLFVVNDRREQRRSEAAIANLAAFAQENPNPILMFSSDGRLIYYNEATVEMSRSLGREHPAACVPPQAPGILQTCLLTGEKRLRINWVQNKRTFSWSFFPHVASGVVHAFVVEMTEQVALENQLRHSQRLEAIGRLAGGVAHEFNNLLSVIQGQAKLVSESNELSPRSRESMQQLLHATERAGQITHQLQTFSRRNQIKLAALDLNSLVSDLAGLLTKTLGDDIRLELHLEENLPATLADRALVEQVLLNLAVRARDSMPNGGELMLGTSLAEFPPDRPMRHPEGRHGRFIKITVADNGHGLDPRLLVYVFEPFFGSERDREDGANGLALSTAYGIVKQHQGWIELTSQPTSGSCFTVYLPVDAPVVGTDLPLTPQAPPPAGPQTVLLVEDDPAVRWTLKSMLEHAGYRVLEAGNPLEALAVWRERQSEIDVLLTDVVMPTGITGLELAQHLSQARPTLKVIFTSGYCIDSLSRGTPLEAGVNFLQKPFDARAFTLALQQQEVNKGAR